MDFWTGIAIGFANVLNWKVILCIALGSCIGTLTGAMPGLGPSNSVALLMPVALSMDTTQQGIALLVSIYLGCMFGGRITSITINIPGDGPAICTAFDGYPMFQQGKGGIAMGMSAFASFIGGFVSFIVLATAAPALARVALKFGSPEYFSIMLFGFAAVVGLADGKYVKSIITLSLGIFISTIGIDTVSGKMRYVFDPNLFEGFSFAVVLMGTYGVGEVMRNYEKDVKINVPKKLNMGALFPSRQDFKNCAGAIARGTVIGDLIGMLPGAGATIATFLTYSTEKSVSRNKENFGKGAIEGVAAPEAANNASVGGAMIPMMALGIPGSGTTAMLLAAMTMFGLQAGPRIFTESADVAWTMIVALIVANIILLFVNTALVPVFITAIRVGQDYLKPLICVVSCIGVFAVTYNVYFIRYLVVFGILGYVFKKYDYPTGPFVLALILAPYAETNFRQSMLISHGSYGIFFKSTICLLFFGLTLLVLFFPVIKKLFTRIFRKEKQAG